MDEPAVILLVEDNAADASMLVELLEELEPRPEVVHVDTGERGLALLRGGDGAPRLRPHLLVSDLKLPGRSGAEITAIIRADSQLQRLPIVILSTSDAQPDVDACHAAGANAYLVKESDPDVMAHKLHAAVRLFCDLAQRPTRPSGA